MFRGVFRCFVVLGLSAVSAQASTIVTRDGRTIEARIVESTARTIWYEDGDGRAGVSKDSVVEVRSGSQQVPLDFIDPQGPAPSGEPEQAALQAEAGEIAIPLNSPVQLSGKGLQDILSLRREYVSRMPALAPKDYQPNMAVFGQIQDGKPWWGFLGINYFGNGEKSILGDSKESRFIINPFLLIGAEEQLAHIFTPAPADPQAFFPTPTRLIWEKGGRWGQVAYNISDYHRNASRYRYPDAQGLYLSDYNARDFGFNFLAIDHGFSQNITAAFDQVVPIIQFIHTGGSCGYPGGCNNKSPIQSELDVQWTQLPARIYVKLWKATPGSVDQKSDMDFIIDLN